MSDFAGDFMKQFGPDVSRQLGANLGVGEDAARQIIPQVIPMIMGGLKRQMETRGGTQRLDHILNKYGSEDVLGNIAGFLGPALGGGTSSSGGGLLGSLIGGLFGKKR